MNRTQSIESAIMDLQNALSVPQRLTLGVHDGKLMLCFEDGEPLPNQAHVTVRSAAEEFTAVTIEFVIDGDRIKYGV